MGRKMYKFFCMLNVYSEVMYIFYKNAKTAKIIFSNLRS